MRKPRFLAAFTWLYFSWSYLPIVVAIRVSLVGDELSGGYPRGWSTRWYGQALENPDLRQAFLNTLRLAVGTILIAVPLGVGLALGIHRWASRAARGLQLMTFLAIGTPQLILGSILFFLAAFTFRVQLGGGAQQVGHITLALPFVTAIVLIRLNAIGIDYEEMAMDLGASPVQALRWVLLPMLGPALIGGAAVAFVISYDNFVISSWLCIPVTCRTIPVYLYGSGRLMNPGPVPYALAVIAFAVSLVVIALAAWAMLAARSRTRISAKR